MNARNATADYDDQAEVLADRYESVAFEQVHEKILDLLPDSPGFVLDIGAGSGRDAGWFVANGHEVVAVEPASRLRNLARRLHPDPRIRWMSDRLPALASVFRCGLTFDLIWLSAVWMHVAPTARARAFRKLVTLLRPGGQIMVTLRRGPPPAGRPMYATSSEEIEKLARSHGLIVVRVARSADQLGRDGVTWETVWLRLPDDGLGALPLLRHIILNDSKSSTYKLALLRILVRIADSATGLARDVDDDTVAVPLGLAALYWIRAYKPLVESGLPQKPPSRAETGLGFVREGAFGALRGISPFSLRLGMRFSGSDGTALLQAMRDAKNTIVRMPAHYITYPGQEAPVFVAETRTPPRGSTVTLDEPFLWSFGSLRIPRPIWQAMARYAAWIEPALLNEWTELMRGYNESGRRTDEDYTGLLRWLDPEHDTTRVRALAAEVRSAAGGLRCVWTGRRLRDAFAVDHCLPFSAWPCNDLWNLLPASPAVNQHKGNRLPSAEILFRSRERMLEWWNAAYLSRAGYAERFVDEATAALPGMHAAPSQAVPEDVFDGLMMQRAVLKRDQQLSEWQVV